MIKFRAWNQIDSEYINEINAVMSLDGSHIWWDINDSGEMKYEDDPGNYKLEQFTGLKDVNGKDIYEGDAVQPVSSYINLKRGKPFEVKKDNYVYGKWIAKDISSKEFSVDGCYFSDEIQLIGNVHENPELLEADK